MIPPADDDLHEQLVLGDLLNHVLDKGVVITGDVTIAVADIDLIRLGVSLFLSAVERGSGSDHADAATALPGNGLPVLPADGGR